MSKSFKIHSGDSGYTPPGYYKEPNPAVIDTLSEECLHKWEEILHLSRAELLDALDEFGPMVKDIRRGMRKKRNEAA